MGLLPSRSRWASPCGCIILRLETEVSFAFPPGDSSHWAPVSCLHDCPVPCALAWALCFVLVSLDHWVSKDTCSVACGGGRIEEHSWPARRVVVASSRMGGAVPAPLPRPAPALAGWLSIGGLPVSPLPMTIFAKIVGPGASLPSLSFSPGRASAISASPSMRWGQAPPGGHHEGEKRVSLPTTLV
jgi:hypothetical protein